MLTNDDLLNGEEIELEAKTENLPQVTGFVESFLERVNCSMNAMMHINVAVDEIFTNISSYAYSAGIGKAKLRAKVIENPYSVVLTFIDSGKPYDPLAKDDPDVSLPASERQIGGLGIFMTKKLMDELSYEYRDGKNILTMKKFL